MHGKAVSLMACCDNQPAPSPHFWLVALEEKDMQYLYELFMTSKFSYVGRLVGTAGPARSSDHLRRGFRRVTGHMLRLVTGWLSLCFLYGWMA